MPQKKTVDALIAQKAEIERQIEEAKRHEALAKLTKSSEFKSVAKQVKDLDLPASDIVDLFDSKKSAPPRKTAKPSAKYKHPADPKMTWSGRGRKPAWVQEWTDSGKSIDELLIKK